MTKTLWQKENPANSGFAETVNSFTVGRDREFDGQLAEFDVLGSLAHAHMLKHTGLINDADHAALEQGLNQILEDIQKGVFEIDEGVEDIHSQIELLLTEKTGEAGKKIHTARSRNDQVLVDMKLYLRHQVKTIAGEVKLLFDRLLHLSETHKTALLPGYTHLQLAMPSSFGLWFAAYAESLSDDLELLVAAYRQCNKNPLGSGAGYGSSFPINRSLTTSLLEFDSMNHNVVYAQMTRGKTEKTTAMAMASVGATLARLAYDCCLYLNQNFGFIAFPDALTTGSSIMPHKKNPDVFELIRARCNRIQALPNELTLLTANLPSGYHRDLQLTKEILFPGIADLKDCIRMTAFMLEHIEVKSGLLEGEMYDALFSVEEVNRLVLEGVPFREAYRKTGVQIANGTFKPVRQLAHTHEGSMGNLCNEAIRGQFYQRLNEILG